MKRSEMISAIKDVLYDCRATATNPSDCAEDVLTAIEAAGMLPPLPDELAKSSDGSHKHFINGYQWEPEAPGSET